MFEMANRNTDYADKMDIISLYSSVFQCLSGNLYSLQHCGSAVKLYFCRRQVFYNVFALQNRLLGSDWGRWELDGSRMGGAWEERGPAYPRETVELARKSVISPKICHPVVLRQDLPRLYQKNAR